MVRALSGEELRLSRVSCKTTLTSSDLASSTRSLLVRSWRLKREPLHREPLCADHSVSWETSGCTASKESCCFRVFQRTWYVSLRSLSSAFRSLNWVGTCKCDDETSWIAPQTEDVADPDRDQFLSFIRATLEWDPSLRSSAKELLKLPWITEGKFKTT